MVASLGITPSLGMTLKRKSMDNSDARKPTCARCRNHGHTNILKGHKIFCRFRTCRCEMCILLTTKQDVQRKQIALRRKQDLLKNHHHCHHPPNASPRRRDSNSSDSVDSSDSQSKPMDLSKALDLQRPYDDVENVRVFHTGQYYRQASFPRDEQNGYAMEVTPSSQYNNVSRLSSDQVSPRAKLSAFPRSNSAYIMHRKDDSACYKKINIEQSQQPTPIFNQYIYDAHQAPVEQNQQNTSIHTSTSQTYFTDLGDRFDSIRPNRSDCDTSSSFYGLNRVPEMTDNFIGQTSQAHHSNQESGYIRAVSPHPKSCILYNLRAVSPQSSRIHSPPGFAGSAPSNDCDARSAQPSDCDARPAPPSDCDAGSVPPSDCDARSAPPGDCDARQLSKLKRFLTTLVQFGYDISPETGDRVRGLVLAVVNNDLSIDEFHAKLQETTDFVIPFLETNLPLLQQELLDCARMDKESPRVSNEHMLFESVHSLVSAHGMGFDEHQKRHFLITRDKVAESESNHSAAKLAQTSPQTRNPVNHLTSRDDNSPVGLHMARCSSSTSEKCDRSDEDKRGGTPASEISLCGSPVPVSTVPNTIGIMTIR